MNRHPTTDGICSLHRRGLDMPTHCERRDFGGGWLVPMTVKDWCRSYGGWNYCPFFLRMSAIGFREIPALGSSGKCNGQ